MRMAALKQRAAALGIDKIDAADAGGYLVFGDDSRIDPVELVQLVQNDNRSYRLQGSHRLSFRLDLEDVEARFKAVEQLIDKLALPDDTEQAG